MCMMKGIHKIEMNQKEIQAWRSARRKNYPTKANIKKVIKPVLRK